MVYVEMETCLHYIQKGVAASLKTAVMKLEDVTRFSSVCVSISELQFAQIAVCPSFSLPIYVFKTSHRGCILLLKLEISNKSYYLKNGSLLDVADGGFAHRCLLLCAGCHTASAGAGDRSGRACASRCPWVEPFGDQKAPGRRASRRWTRARAELGRKAGAAGVTQGLNACMDTWVLFLIQWETIR